MSKKSIVILRGGPSSEHEVSLKTGRSVIDTLKDHHDILDVIIDKKGRWYVSGLERQPHEVIKGKDVVFNAMHGEYGEDGQVQELLEKLQIPFTGPKKFGAVLSINKPNTKKIYQSLGLKTPHSKVIDKIETDTDNIALDLFRNFPMPMIIKPIDKGSSVGLSIVRDFQSLKSTLAKLFETSNKLLVEEFIEGKEGTVGVINDFRNEKEYALLPIEIRTPKNKEVFDYEAKYNGSTEEICPGDFSLEESSIMQEAAKKVHEALNLRHYSRTDFIIHPRRGVFLLETNSLPGLTSESLLPKSLEPIGSSYREFLEHVINLAIEDSLR